MFSDLVEQKTLLKSLSLKLETLLSSGEKVVKPSHPSTSNQFSPEAQIVQNLNGNNQANHNMSVASIDSEILDSTPMNHLNSRQMTI